MRIYLFIHLVVCLFMHLLIYSQSYLYICIYIYIYAYMHICIMIYLIMYIVYICIYILIHIHIYKYIYIYNDIALFFIVFLIYLYRLYMFAYGYPRSNKWLHVYTFASMYRYMCVYQDRAAFHTSSCILNQLPNTQRYITIWLLDKTFGKFGSRQIPNADF